MCVCLCVFTVSGLGVMNRINLTAASSNQCRNFIHVSSSFVHCRHLHRVLTIRWLQFNEYALR